MFNLKNGSSNKKNNDDDGDNNNNDNNNDDDDDDGQTTDLKNACPQLSNECLDFFKNLSKGGYPSSNQSRPGSIRHAKVSSSSSFRTLGKKPKIGNFKKMKDIFQTD